MSIYDKKPYSLVGQDGNAYSITGYTAQAMKQCNLYGEIDSMYKEATCGDYNNLICVCDSYIQKCNATFEPEWDDEDDEDWNEDDEYDNW